jgi:hypothetical protein
MKASLRENGKFDAMFAKVKPNDRDVIIKFESDYMTLTSVIGTQYL